MGLGRGYEPTPDPTSSKRLIDDKSGKPRPDVIRGLHLVGHKKTGTYHHASDFGGECNLENSIVKQKSHIRGIVPDHPCTIGKNASQRNRATASM